METKVGTLFRRSSKYNMTMLKDQFRNEEEWADKIASMINGSDVVILSVPRKYEKDYFFNERFEDEQNLSERIEKSHLYRQRQRDRFVKR